MLGMNDSIAINKRRLSFLIVWASINLSLVQQQRQADLICGSIPRNCGEFHVYIPVLYPISALYHLFTSGIIFTYFIN